MPWDVELTNHGIEITCSQPANLHSTKSQCLLFILSAQWRTANSRILMSDKFRLNTLMEASSNGLFMSKMLSCVLLHSTSSSKISVSVSWYSSRASSTPLVCWNHWWREPSMTANTRAKPRKNSNNSAGGTDYSMTDIRTHWLKSIDDEIVFWRTIEFMLRDAWRAKTARKWHFKLNISRVQLRVFMNCVCSFSRFVLAPMCRSFLQLRFY